MNAFGLCIPVLLFLSCGSGGGYIEETSSTDYQQDSALRAQLSTHDSIRQAIQAIGNFTLIATEDNEKCNLVKGFYSLNNVPVDSSDLVMLSKHLAFEL